MPVPKLSIVIPAFEERRRLPGSLATLDGWLSSHASWNVEVIVVVEPGGDGTAAWVEGQCREMNGLRAVFPTQHRGKGAAVREGLRVAFGERVVFMDADLSTGLDALDLSMRVLDGDPEVGLVIGNRQNAASRIERSQSLLRERLGKTFNRILAWIGCAPFADTQCGFKMLTREALEKILPEMQVDGFAFDVEMLLLAARHGIGVADVPVRWTDSPKSKVRLIQDSLRMLFDVLVLKARLG